MIRLPEDVRSSLRFFAFYLANGTVDMELLADVDYRPELMRYGSDLERVFAIFSNVLEVDEEGNVTNHDVAQRRAAQWIRRFCDPSYEVVPPFEGWEIELV